MDQWHYRRDDFNFQNGRKMTISFFKVIIRKCPNPAKFLPFIELSIDGC